MLFFDYFVAALALPPLPLSARSSQSKRDENPINGAFRRSYTDFLFPSPPLAAPAPALRRDVRFRE